MSTHFTLHSQLEADSHWVGDATLCRVLLMNDARYPWLILVPMAPNMTELHELAQPDRSQLMQEVSALAMAMKRELGADKINTAALGNLVPQLHIHVIARYHNDPTWPAPVWGVGKPAHYTADALQARLGQARGWLA